MGGTVSAKRPVEHGSRGPGAGDQSPSRGTGPVLLRAARLLEAFSHDRPTLTLSELARRSGLPLTTAYRLVADLVACGFLERDEHDLYHIGLKLWEIASLAPQRESLRDAALPFMEDLFQVTSENVQLAVREGEESVFVERLSGHRSIPVINRVGGRLPLHPTGVGRVLLAFAPQDVQEKVLASPLKSFSPLTVTSPVELRRILADVRARGFAVNESGGPLHLRGGSAHPGRERRGRRSSVHRRPGGAGIGTGTGTHRPGHRASHLALTRATGGSEMSPSPWRLPPASTRGRRSASATPRSATAPSRTASSPNGASVPMNDGRVARASSPRS